MDKIFKALADPARLTLLDSLKDDDGQTLQQLQAQLEMTRFGVMKHLTVLEDAGLIVTKKVGRFKHHYLNAVPLQEAIDRFIDPYRVKPAARAVLDLKAQLEKTPLPVQKPDFSMTLYIQCTPDAIWDALRNAQSAGQYVHRAAHAERDGDTLTLFDNNGAPLFLSTDISLSKNTRIEASFEPVWAPNLPTSRITYQIETDGELCALTLNHFGLPPDSSTIQDDWARTLSNLKSWLETGRTPQFTTARE